MLSNILKILNDIVAFIKIYTLLIIFSLDMQISLLACCF